MGIGFERVRDPERVAECKLRYQIPRPGKHSYVLHAFCDAYVGLDTKVDLNFVAKTEDEVKREIILHKEDEELELIPTLFQQMMGDVNKDEDSDEEEEEGEDGDKKKTTTKKPSAKAKAAGKKDDKKDEKKDDSDSDSSSS